MSGWGRCGRCGYNKTGIRDGQICAPCAALGAGSGTRSAAARMAPAVAAAMAELDARKAAWDADYEERYLRAYVAEGIRMRRPDPWGCMRHLLNMRRRWVDEDAGR